MRKECSDMIHKNIHLTSTEIAAELLKSCVLTMGIAWLFYESYLALLIAPLVSVWILRSAIQRKDQRIRTRMKQQFLVAVKSMGTSLYAGYSAENAIHASIGEIAQLYGEKAELVQEFRFMERQMQVQVPLTRLFLDLGRRTGVPDIENFAAVFQIARQTGGNLAEIIRQTVIMLEEKRDVEQEIETALAARRLEQWIMCAMPASILLYLKLTSPGYFRMVYGNLPGILFMTVCLVVYGFACQLGKWILEIEV